MFNGRPFFEGLDTLGRTFLVTETMSLVQFGIGEMGNGMYTKWEGSIPHMLLHGGVGCIAIEALRGNCASGFFAGVSQSVLAGSNLTDAQKLQLAPLVGAVAGFFGAEGQAIGVSYAATIAQSGLVNNYLTHEQWKRLTAALASCKGDQLCIDRTWTAYEVLSRQQNDAYVTCVANGDMQCIQNVRDELSIVDFAENKALISRTLADLGLGGRRYADLLDLDQTALNITEVVYGDANHITREEAQALFALDRAMLCTASMPLATCLQTITDARRDRGNAALGLIADLIPIIGDAKGAAECLMKPSVLTCGGALLGVLPLAGDGAKILIRNGDRVIAVTRGGATLDGFDPFASIRSQIATAEDVARLTKAQIGSLGETVARNMLTQNGYTVLMSVQNASGNGIDVLARAADGSLVALEVKTTGRGTIGSLTPTQAKSADYVFDIVKEIKESGTLRGQNVPQLKTLADSIWPEVEGRYFSTVAVGIKLLGEGLFVSKW